jgi:hypothetical protein
MSLLSLGSKSAQIVCRSKVSGKEKGRWSIIPRAPSLPMLPAPESGIAIYLSEKVAAAEDGCGFLPEVVTRISTGPRRTGAGAAKRRF